MIEILSNLLRSVIVLTPDDLIYVIYLCLNRLAPAYEGVELGIGETLLMKTIVQTTGNLMNHCEAVSCYRDHNFKLAIFVSFDFPNPDV